MLSKKDRANPLLMEARLLLLNQVNVGSDGLLVAVDELRTFIYGAAEGEHKVRISGITTRDFLYRTKYNSVKAVYQASEAMKNIGRRAHLQCMDNAAACIIKSPVFYPVVIVFYENSNGRMQLSAYTGRAFLSLFAINSALKKFDKELPDAMVRKVSIHSVHDVNMAIIHSIKRLINKDDGRDDREYVDLKKLFKSGRRRNRAPGRQEKNKRISGAEPGEPGWNESGYDSLATDSIDGYESVRTESREERKTRKKAERLEKKREAARRKYEKLMGIEPENSEADNSGASGMMNGGVTEGFEADDSEYIDNYSGEYPNEDNVDDEDILSDFTGLSRDELEALEEDDEDILSEFTGLSRDELEALEEDDEDILSDFTGLNRDQAEIR